MVIYKETGEKGLAVPKPLANFGNFEENTYFNSPNKTTSLKVSM